MTRKLFQNLFSGTVPEGHLEIAQRFNVGSRAKVRTRPEGTVDAAGRPLQLSRPCGTRSYRLANPALKRWAIAGCPSGTTPASFEAPVKAIG